MAKNIYKEIKISLEHMQDRLFNEILIDLCIAPNYFLGSSEETPEYVIFNLTADCSNSSNQILNKEVETFTEQLNKRIKLDQDNKKYWKIFYLIKEIFQEFVSNGDDRKFNYFRGQACDWKLIPGIFREDTSENFIENFETIYKNVAYEYPSEIEYVEYEKNNIAKRSKQLSILQHYGLRTSLVDVTKNPYIAMLFMVSDSCKNDFNQGTIDLFRINEEVHCDKNIFMPVAKSDHNKRLTAQKGAFFNYDILFDLKNTDVKPIDRIILKINYSCDLIEKKINEQISKSNNELSNIKTNNSNSEFNETLKLIDELINEQLIDKYQKLLDNVENLKSDIYKNIREEIKIKLEEYYYFENALFPDLDRYIGYLQSNYIDNDVKKKLNVDG